MTTYTTIPDSDIDPESPGTTTLFTRLRDNPIAITEGAIGAPQIVNAAITNGTIGAEKLQAGTDEATWVLGRTSAASVGSLGTYAFLKSTFSGTLGQGGTLAGSALTYAITPIGAGAINPSGTWMLMGHHLNTDSSPWASVWLRIA